MLDVVVGLKTREGVMGTMTCLSSSRNTSCDMFQQHLMCINRALLVYYHVQKCAHLHASGLDAGGAAAPKTLEPQFKAFRNTVQQHMKDQKVENA